MKYVFLLALSVILVCCNHVNDRRYTSETNLGEGFIERRYEVDMPPDHWEAIGHYSTVFYKEKELGMLDGFAISPTKKYAIYTKSKEGRLFIFDISKRAEKRVLIDEYCYPSCEKWDDTNGIVEIKCLAGNNRHFYLTINLKTGETKKILQDE